MKAAVQGFLVGHVGMSARLTVTNSQFFGVLNQIENRIVFSSKGNAFLILLCRR